MTNKEIRNKAWDLLWHKNWVGKLILVTSALQFSSSLIMSLISDTLKSIGIISIEETLTLIKRDGIVVFFDSPFEYISVITMFLFFSFLMTGIVNYGTSKILNNAADNDPNDWFKSAFGAFKMPFEVLCLQFLFALITFLFILFFASPFIFLAFKACSSFIPGTIGENPFVSPLFLMMAFLSVIFALSVPFYRYRYIFRVKADHPDWTARECLSYSKNLTSGHKLRLLKLDLSYTKAFLVPLVIPLISIDPLSLIVFAVSLSIATLYNGVGQSILYRELSAGKP